METCRILRGISCLWIYGVMVSMLAFENVCLAV